VPEDRDEAKKWYELEARLNRTLADQSDPTAQLALGRLYQTGRGVEEAG
jgi:TPR repeat protein